MNERASTFGPLIECREEIADLRARLSALTAELQSMERSVIPEVWSRIEQTLKRNAKDPSR